MYVISMCVLPIIVGLNGTRYYADQVNFICNILPKRLSGTSSSFADICFDVRCFHKAHIEGAAYILLKTFFEIHKILRENIFFSIFYVFNLSCKYFS